MSEVPRIEAVLGTRVRLSYELDISGVPVDPVSLTLLVRSRQGGSVSVSPWSGANGTIIKDNVGRFHADVVPTAEGDWFYRFAGYGVSNTPMAATEGEFRVTSLLPS